MLRGVWRMAPVMALERSMRASEALQPCLCPSSLGLHERAPGLSDSSGWVLELMLYSKGIQVGGEQA